MGPVLTVAVCTLDRADLLAGCLDAIAAQRVPGAAIEVLVIDNGSVDHTAAVVAAHPSMRRIVESMRGLSHARNTALREARGELVAFIDDDARPEPGWAAALIAAGARWPQAGAVGGPVELEWPARRPAWLTPQLERWYSGRDLGPDARLLADHEHPVGTNLTLRRDAAVAAGGFAAELGRVGRALGSEEEVLLLRRLWARGSHVAWEPAAAVRHVVDPSRMTARWLLRRSWAQGRSDVVAARLEDRPLRAGSLRSAGGALLAGWPATLRAVVGSANRRAAVVRELVHRVRRLAQVWEARLSG